MDPDPPGAPGRRCGDLTRRPGRTEGGFLGFGAEQVSAGEQQMLEQVRAALGVG
jgi:hypothetical protein